VGFVASCKVSAAVQQKCSSPTKKSALKSNMFEPPGCTLEGHADKQLHEGGKAQVNACTGDRDVRCLVSQMTNDLVSISAVRAPAIGRSSVRSFGVQGRTDQQH
jgi:hypothetical protein